MFGLGKLLARQLAVQFAVIHHKRAVTGLDDLLRLARGDDDADALLCQRHDLGVYFVFGAHVHALCGVGEDHQPGFGSQPLRQHRLLLVAAREAGDGVVQIRRLDAQRVARLVGRLCLQPAGNAQSPPQLVDGDDGDVVLDRKVLNDGVLLAVGGQKADAQLSALRGMRRLNGLAAQENLSALPGKIAEQAPHQLLLAVAQKPGESHNLARMHAEGDVLDRPLHAQVLHPQKLLADLVLLVDLYAQHVPADHHARDVGLADLLAVRLHNRAVGHLLAVAQNRVAVGKTLPLR